MATLRKLLICMIITTISLCGSAQAYNILALDMGGYWNNMYHQHFGAQLGYGTPGASGERWYTMVSPSDLASTNLLRYDVLMVQSGFTDDWVLERATAALNALNDKAGDIQAFMQAGRGLVACSEPLPSGVANLWDWSPVFLNSWGTYHENQVEIVDPAHPVMAHSTNQSLSDWHSSWHGWFDAWDARLHPLARTGDYGVGDPRTHQVLTLAGAYGSGGWGRMVFTMQDPDYHAYQGFDGAKTMMRDALDWVNPVPEPQSVLLLLAGLGGWMAVAAWRRLR